jgi:REP element-mobilizing transposase RayT
VVLRTTAWTPRLRCGAAYRARRRVLVRYLGRAGFRIVHISIQRDHLHLLVEVADRRALARGMQSFAINAARAIQRGPGNVFAYRYHATQLKTAWHRRERSCWSSSGSASAASTCTNSRRRKYSSNRANRGAMTRA